MLNSTRLRLYLNPRVRRSEPYDRDGRQEILSLAALAQAKREIASWPGYKPTPLRGLAKLAGKAGIAEILYKDEGGRFAIGSFKALGGAYAVLRLLQRHILAQRHETPSARDLAEGRYSDLASQVTVTCATDGNHGRSVAWGARTFGARCIIYMPDIVSPGRARAIESYGAEVRRVAGSFDDAVRQAAADAEAQGWHVVPDTAPDNRTEPTCNLMQGYALMIDEACSQNPAPLSHIFVQGGVGGLAAAVCSYFWERHGGERPFLVVVEPEHADGHFRSVVAGKPTPAEGPLDSIMGGLACAEISGVAWQILGPGADAFAAIGDDAAIDCMRLLAEGRFGDDPIVAGESAVAGLSALLLACADLSARNALQLTAESRVLVLGTEGATDPETYRRIVGRSPEEVAASRRAA